MNKSYSNVLILALTLLIAVTGCSVFSQDKPQAKFIISAIPDQDPAVLQQLYTKVATYLSEKLNIPVEYQAAQTYDTVIDLFRLGKVDMVWFGGLTGVQARLRVEGAQAIAQRDIDATFHSVFITNTSTGLKPFDSVEGLKELEGHSFTFGSESSTSGRLMPEYFLGQAGVDQHKFTGPVFFSGSHDKTVDLVKSGQYDVGVLNRQVWDRRVKSGEDGLDKLVVLWETPAFFDYHWLIHPQVTQRYGADFIKQVQTAFLSLNSSVPEQADILKGFGAGNFIVTQNDNYAALETTARQLGLIQN